MSTDSPEFKYNRQVFLSFKGGDTRKSVIDPLCTALVNAGLRPFIYFDEFSSGSELDLKQAIQESGIGIVVLSQNYTSTNWCMRELMMILEWSKIRDNGGVILPVFYGVDPSEVVLQKTSIEYISNTDALTDVDLDMNLLKIDDKWAKEIKNGRDALTEVAIMTGIVLQNGGDRYVPKIMESLVGFIRDGLKTNTISSWGNKVCELMGSGLSKLPNDMVFPVLEELFLQDNKYLLTIPPSFFNFMPSLQVLDLSRTSIKKLPMSISNLAKLQKLFMRDCKLLMELPSEIQDLKNLQIFDLSGTELTYIPKEIEKLLKLEILRMSLCTSADEYVLEINKSKNENKIEIIPKNTLSKLSNLKELSIFVDTNCKWWGAIVEFVILDLVSLKNLQILKLYFPNVDILQRFFENQKVCQSLSNFKLVVGGGDQRVISRFNSQELQDEFETLGKCLKYVNGTEDLNEVVKGCKYAETLFLDRHRSIKRLSVLKRFCENLRFCVLVECNKMINVIDGMDLCLEGDNEDMGNAGTIIIRSLQYLSIHCMKSLTSIWVGPFISGSMNNLQILALSNCPNLNTIFDKRLLCNLPSLKELMVEDCPNVESLVSVDSSNLEYGKELLPCLKKITLLFLPELVSLSRGLKIAPRLVSMVVYDCPKLQTLSPMEVCSKCIKEIKGESEWWETLERRSDQLDVFVPLGEDGLMNQLAEARTSSDVLRTIQNTDAYQVTKQSDIVPERDSYQLAKATASQKIFSTIRNSREIKKKLLEKMFDVFFQDAKNLKDLNVDGTGITSLPTSTSTLDGVKVIYLSEFPVQNLKLSTIEVLDIRSSKIQIIPPEVANLSKLRRFLVSFPGLIQGDNHAIVSKNCNVISAVPNMKELIIDVKLLKQSCKKMHQFVILKIGKSKLQSLTTFKFCFHGGVEDNVIQMVAGTPIFSVPNSKVFDGFLQRRVVSSAFEVYIGDSTFPQIPNFKSYERYLGYGNGKSSRKLIRMLLTKVDALEFRHLDGIQNVSDFGIENLQNVQGFLIESCKDVQAIASVVNSPVLPNLKELYVKKMSVLKRIVKGPILLDSLCKLRILKIENCHLIKELFIFSGHTTLHANFLPHLETLILIDMKSLTSICLYKSLDWPSLKTVQIEDCLKLAELPFGKDNANNLELIKAEKSWWDNLKWQEEEVLIRLSQLFANSGEGQTVTTGRVIP